MKTRTVIVIKPDCSGNGVMFQELLGLLIDNCLKIVYCEMIQRTRYFWLEFYIAHKGQPYYEPLVEWMSSGFANFLLVEGEGEDVVQRVRTRIVVPLRKKYQTSDQKNAIHASDSPITAEREAILISD